MSAQILDNPVKKKKVICLVARLAVTVSRVV